MAFTPNVLLQLHGMLYRYMPNPGGGWKPADNDIIERQPDGSVRVRFKPVAAHLTPMALDQLASNYGAAVQKPNLDSLIVVPRSFARMRSQSAGATSSTALRPRLAMM